MFWPILVFLSIFGVCFSLLKQYFEGWPDDSNPFIGKRWTHECRYKNQYSDDRTYGFPPEKIFHRFSVETGGGHVWIWHKYHLKLKYYLLIFMIATTIATPFSLICYRLLFLGHI